MGEMIVKMSSKEIKNAKDEAEESWALDAALKIYGAATDVINPLIPKYNELWDDIEINALDDDGCVNEEAPYNKRHDEWCKLTYDAMSYIYGVNPKTHRIVKLDSPYILIHKDGDGVIFAHVEDFEMD